MSDDLVVEPRAEQLPEDDSTVPKVGRWYWLKSETAQPNTEEDDEAESVPTPEEGPRRLVCVVRLGSNYVSVGHIGGTKERIHIDEFWDRCEFESDPDSHIQARVDLHQRNVHALMDRVKEITARLAITPGLALSSGSEVRALAVRTDLPMKEYQAALVLAKEETLPELFKAIKNENEALGLWLSSKLIPLEAQAQGLEPAISSIKERIFSVQLYAGLVEQVEQIREGEPAALSEPVHLIQRRAYMDEECLAQYETGGMEFKHLRNFDRWLAKPSNLHRILPFPRCIVAFQVRRNRKERDVYDVASYLQMIEDQEADELTFLYIRNGEQLFRLSTEIEFDQKLFPDMDRQTLNGKVYARIFGGPPVEKVISENEYKGMVEEERRKEREAAKLPEHERWFNRGFHESQYYVAFDRETVYYDDIAKFIHNEMAKHNRLVLVLQGLLDRSPVLHPHPPWSLWTSEGFTQALRLIYDDSRALVAGSKPDFEAYRASLNASLQTGSITIGQEEAWERYEARKENDRRDRDWRHAKDRYRHKRFRPSGNPGPGKLARVAKFSKRSGQCTYEWARAKARQGWDNDAPKEIGCSFTVPSKVLLNVDAYKPGDFKKFFSDPRTRVEYLKWAPLLLEAEEYHAGNRKVAPVKAKPSRQKTDDGSYLYRKRKQRRALLGKAVRLKYEVKTQGGKTYLKGSLWRVSAGRGDLFDIHGITPDGLDEPYDSYTDRRAVRCVDMHKFEVDPTIPADPAIQEPSKLKKRRPVEDDEDE